MHRIHENISLAKFHSKWNIMLCSQMSCIAITPKRQRVHKIIKLNKAQNEAHKKCMKLANERRGKSSRAGDPFILQATLTLAIFQQLQQLQLPSYRVTGWSIGSWPLVLVGNKSQIHSLLFSLKTHASLIKLKVSYFFYYLLLWWSS